MPSPNLAPIKNPTPREQFRESGDNVTKHRNLVDSPEFNRAVHYALLEYQTLLVAQAKDGNSSMAVGFRLQGALELMGVMRNLAEPAPIIQRLAERGLNHDA